MGFLAYNKFSLLKFRDFFSLPEARLLFKYYFLNAAGERIQYNSEMFDKEASCYEAVYRLSALFYQQK